MATMTTSLPEPMKDWIEARIREGEYASTSG
jgi:antitoxin ParD1/3/4